MARIKSIDADGAIPILLPAIDTAVPQLFMPPETSGDRPGSGGRKELACRMDRTVSNSIKQLIPPSSSEMIPSLNRPPLRIES